MGKRKSSKPPPKKQKPKLDVAFSCPFCNSDKSVTATMDWNNEVHTTNIAGLSPHVPLWPSSRSATVDRLFAFSDLQTTSLREYVKQQVLTSGMLANLFVFQVGKVECNVCHESYSTSIHKLTEAIDVYSDWIDACEDANNRE